MANTAKVVKVSPFKGGKQIYVTIELSGNYVQAVGGANTGEVIDLTTMDNSVEQPVAFGFGLDGPALAVPVQGHIAGYPCELIDGADKFHKLLRIYKAVGTELDAGAYPAAITANSTMIVVTDDNF